MVIFMHSRPRRWRAAARRWACRGGAAAALFVLTGCSATAPALLTPKPVLASRFAHGDAAAAARPAERDWWSGFEDPVLLALVDEALRANQDLAIAKLRVRQARAGVDAQASRLWPTVGLQASSSRSDSDLPVAVKQGQPDVRAHRIAAELSWEMDLAGGVRAARDAAQADAAAAQAGVVGVRLQVASEVGRQYFILRAAQEQLRILNGLAAAQRQTAERVASREREGQASAFNLARAHADADALDAQVPALRTLAGVTQTRLAVLLGRDPSSPVLSDVSAFRWPKPRIPAPGQPSDLLRNRPDLLAAEARVSAEGLRTEEARAQWWPKLFVSALLGRQRLQLNALDLAPVPFSNVALAFAMPVFNAGRIDAGIQRQSARAEEALVAWQRSVLIAVQEVENSLLVQAQEAERAKALAQTVANRRRSLQQAESLRREGQIDQLTLLDVQRSVLASELTLSDSQLQQALADVQLYMALGGGVPTADPAESVAPRTSK